MIKENVNIVPCPVHTAMKVVGGKWKLQILYKIGNEKRRFGELKRLNSPISEKMLIQELKHLVSTGILKRKSFAEVPPRVEYSLTEKGQKVLPIIEEVKKYGASLIKKD